MNNQVLELPRLDKIELEASDWVEKIDRGLDAHEYRAFKQWVARSKRHHDSVVAMAELWNQMDIAAILQDSEVISLSEWREDDEEVPFYVSVLAVLVLVLGLFGAGIHFFQDIDRFANPTVGALAKEQSKVTAVGEVRTLVLPDATSLSLNTNSQADIYFSQELRSVVLNRGEVYVAVSREAERPFLMVVNGRLIRVNRGSFNLRVLDNNLVELTVVRGEAFVNEPQKNSSSIQEVLQQPVTAGYSLSSGYRVLLGAHAETRSSTDNEILLEKPYRIDAQTLYSLSFWRDGKLLFTGQTLETAMDDIRRYTHKEIILADENVKNVRVNGLFDSNDIEELLRVVALEASIKVFSSPANVISLHSE